MDEAPAVEADDGGKILESTAHVGTCKSCKRDVPVKSRVRYFTKDKTMICEECLSKAA